MTFNRFHWLHNRLAHSGGGLAFWKARSGMVGIRMGIYSETGVKIERDPKRLEFFRNLARWTVKIRITWVLVAELVNFVQSLQCWLLQKPRKIALWMKSQFGWRNAVSVYFVHGSCSIEGTEGSGVDLLFYWCTAIFSEVAHSLKTPIYVNASFRFRVLHTWALLIWSIIIKTTKMFTAAKIPASWKKQPSPPFPTSQIHNQTKNQSTNLKITHYPPPTSFAQKLLRRIKGFTI